MALTKFVNNVEDLTDDGGLKFRFKCDRCQDGFESQYIASKANILKTAIDVFSVFNPLGRYGVSDASKNVDRGLRGKERDAAYERAVGEAMAFFKKCADCGHWVCPEHCWNDARGLCNGCAPESSQAVAKEVNRREIQRAIDDVMSGAGAVVGVIHCGICGARSGGGKFCQACGAPLSAKRACSSCRMVLDVNAKFCGECGVPA